MSNWFVFFVKTGREHTSCHLLNKYLDKSISVAFVPQVELVFRNSKFIRKELKPMFPGYIFVESLLDGRSFILETSRLVKFSNSILCLIREEKHT